LVCFNSDDPHLRITDYVGDLCVQHESCILVRGITSILTTRDSAAVESDTNSLIERAFEDWDYLTQFSNVDDVSLALFLGVNLVVPTFDEDILDDPSKTSRRQKLRIGVIAAIASMTITALVLYLFYRLGDPADGYRKNKMLFLQAKRRRFFQDLDNQNSLPKGWMVASTHSSNHPAPLPKDGTVTWSVSDITSDAESIMSNLPLERIVEVDDEMSSAADEEAVPDRSDAASFRTARSPVKITDLEFIANWKEHSHDFSPGGAEDIAKELKMIYDVRKTVLWTEEETGQEESSVSPDGTELYGCGFFDENGDVESSPIRISDDDTADDEDDDAIGIIVPAQSSSDDSKYHTPTANETHSGDELDYEQLPDNATATIETTVPKDADGKDAGTQSPLLQWAHSALQTISKKTVLAMQNGAN
jgi:hypothetical protein